MGTMKFEYYTQDMNVRAEMEYKVELDAMGSLGWELVKIIETSEGWMHVFKREVVDKPPEKELLLDGVQQSYKHEE